MEKQFSLRRKILILLIAVSLFSGLTFLAISIVTFKNDKIAYIFETNNNFINSTSEQVKNDIRSATNEVKLMLLKMVSDGTFMGIQDKTLSETSTVDAIKVYKLDVAKNLQLFSELKKTEFDSFEEANKVLHKLVVQKGKALTLLDDYVLVAETLKMGTEDLVVIYYFRSRALQVFFEKGKSSLSYLVDSTGKIIKADQALNSDYVSRNFLKSFQEIKKLSSTTLRIKTMDDKKWLMTSVALGYEDYYMISMTDEDQAMYAIKRLTTEAILIFAIIFFAIVIVGVFTSNYLTSRLSQLTAATKKVISGDYKFVVQAKGNDEITELSNNFNQMTFEIVRLLGETAHKARMEAELRTAHTVQETLFPERECKFQTMHIKGEYLSASECGGDWWHYSENSDFINVWIADATGHGASAALLTSAAKSAVSLIERMNATPAQSMELLNQAICSVSKNNMMMTCFLGVFNKRTKVLTYVNASHEPPIVMKRSAAIVKKDFVFLNDSVAPRLGQSLASAYTESQVQLVSGDRILFYTDGIPDIQNTDQEPLGERGFMKILVASCNQQLGFVEFSDSFTSSLTSYRQSTELSDDVTYCFTEIT